MPAVVSHYLVAEKVYNTLLKKHPSLNINRTSFIWGASGPDIFFAHRILPWQKGKSLRYVGTEMHNTPADEIINYFTDYSKNNKDGLCFSYTLGFVTHYTFDSTAHPFVLYFSNLMSHRQPFKHKSVCHNEIESALDTMFLKLEKNERISDFKLQSASPADSKVNLSIARLYHSYLLSEKGMEISPETMEEVQRDWNKGLSMLNDSHQLKKSVVQTGEKILRLKPILSPIIRTPHPDLKNDYANMQKREWFSQTDEKVHNENFFELADKAVKKALEIIDVLMSGKKLPHSMCKASFSGHE